MEILQAIQNRRSVAKVTSKPVVVEDIKKIIQAGCWAPTHYRTEPWRFTVFTGEGRTKLQEAWEQNISRTAYYKLDKIKNKAYRAPAIIAVWCAADREKKNPPIWEDQAAVAACLQNMNLACHAMGLGCIWRTGNVVDMPEVQKLCKTENDTFTADRGDKIIGFLYVGHPDTNASKPTRDKPKAEDKIYFIES
jgi:nitroreductase